MSGQSEAKIVNGLAAACEDGAQAFRSALKVVANRDLKQVFYDLAIEREHTAAELRKLVHDLGDMPKESGSASGLALRIYADLKAALASNEEKAVLEELERSEDRILGRFKAALQSGLSVEIKDTVRACHSEILGSRQKIDALRQRAAHGST